jgi:hypothetical protein
VRRGGTRAVAALVPDLFLILLAVFCICLPSMVRRDLYELYLALIFYTLFVRFAILLGRSEPEILREQLQEVIDAELQGKMNPTLRLRKKALQQAYDLAIKKTMVRKGRN